ncbi:ankyrin repeat-containing domain protein [Aspergillus pseudoustus]|uniref:Ankyrin repeat-containing domain protein n=1 Tax=Aspergillus pseudoustus TaxID=1810923 RepID=A0ABR4JN69_9EURO
MNLLDLPGELILLIAQLLNAKQLSRFSRTSRHVHPLVMALLYRRNIKYGHSSGVNKQLTPLEDPSGPGSFYRNMEADLEDYKNPSPLTDPSGLPLPVTAEIRARDRVLGEFVKHGADINTLTQRNRYGQEKPLLLHAVSERNLAAAILLVKHGAEIYAVRDSWGRAALHWAAIGGCAKILRYLLTHSGAQRDIHVRDEDGQTPFQYAAESGNVAAIRLILEAGADIDAQDEEGNTALHLMMMNGKPAPDSWCIPALRVMFELGVDTEKRLFEDGKTALHIAVLNGRDTDFMEVLLQEGKMDLNCRTVEGRTPLSCAVEKGDAEIFNLLLNAGADRETRDEEGRTLLQTALVDEDRAWASLPTLLEQGLYTLDSDAGEGKTLLQALEEQDWMYVIQDRVDGLSLD